MHFKSRITFRVEYICCAGLRVIIHTLGTPIDHNHYFRKAVHISIGGTTKEINHRAVFTFNLLLHLFRLYNFYQTIKYFDADITLRGTKSNKGGLISYFSLFGIHQLL